MKRCKHWPISKEEEEAAFQLQQVLDSVKNIPERKRIPKGFVNIDNKTRSGTSRAQYCRSTPKIGSRETEQAAILRKQGTDTSSRCGNLFVHESQPSFCAIEPLLDTDKLIEELSSQADVLLADYQSQINQRRLDSSVQCHQQRREASEVAWQNARPNLMNGYISFMGDLYEESVCQICQLNTMKIRCYTCCKVLCAACDAARHTFDALHNRSAKMDDGSIKKLSPCETVSQCGRLTMEERFLPVILRCRNFNCGRLTNPAKEGGTKVIAVTVDGRHDVNIPSGWCSLCSEHTSALDVRNKRDLVASGFWPGSPTHSQGICIYAIGLFDLIETIKIYSPSLSLHAFVKTLDDMSARRGELTKIHPSSFSEAFHEFRRCRFSFGEFEGLEPFSCPACSTGCHAVHIDGNMKLYRFRGTNRSTQPAYCDGDFIQNSDEVEKFVQQVRKGIPGASAEESQADASCGDSTYAAARDKPLRYRTLDETGLCSACCRHGVLLAAVNMQRGEIFAYPFAVQLALAKRGIVPDYLCQDVICKYDPWLQRILDNCKTNDLYQRLRQSKPFLSVFHAKTHNAVCQILRGGRTVAGSANQSGEEMEQVHADISRLQQVTKKMRKELRNETITMHAAARNKNKQRSQPPFLHMRLLRTVVEHEKELKKLQQTGKSRESLLKIKTELQGQAQYLEHLPKARKLSQRELDLISGSGNICPGREVVVLMIKHRRWLESAIQKKEIAVAEARRDIEKVADGSKRRFVLRQKLSKLSHDKEQLQQQASEMESTLDKFGIERPVLVRIKLDSEENKLVTIYDQISRLEEEVPLIIKELNAYASYYSLKIEKLEIAAEHALALQQNPGRYSFSADDRFLKQASLNILRSSIRESDDRREMAMSFIASARSLTLEFARDFLERNESAEGPVDDPADEVYTDDGESESESESDFEWEVL